MTAYCSVEDVTAAGRLDIKSDGSDVSLSMIIDAASELVDKFCRVPTGGFCVTQDETKYYDMCDLRGNKLILDTPFISVTSLTDGSGRTFQVGNYRLWPWNFTPKREIHLLSSYAWSWTTDGRITVVGKFGYSETVPPAIREATAVYSAWMFKRWQAALQDATANAELGQVIYGSDMPKQVKSILVFYRDGTQYL